MYFLKIGEKGILNETLKYKWFYSRNQDESDEEEMPTSSKKKSKTELNQLKKRLKNIMKKVIDYSDEWVSRTFIFKT